MDRAEEILKEQLKIDKAVGFGKLMWDLHKSTIKKCMQIYVEEQLLLHNVGWRSELLPEFDVQEINEILQDCKEKKEDLQALICRIWNKGYMTAVCDEREG